MNGPAGDPGQGKPRLAEDLAVEISGTLFASKTYIAAVTFADDDYFVADAAGHKILWLNQSGQIKKVIGNGNPGLVDGTSGDSLFRFPHRLTFSHLDKVLYVSDWGNGAIRAYHLNTDTVSTLAQGKEMGGEAAFVPVEIEIAQNRLFVTSATSENIFFKDLSDSDADFQTLNLPENSIAPLAMVSSKEFNLIYIIDRLSHTLFAFDFGNSELRRITDLENFCAGGSLVLQVFAGEVIAYLGAGTSLNVLTNESENGADSSSIERYLTLYHVKEDSYEMAKLPESSGPNIGLAHSSFGLSTWDPYLLKINSDTAFIPILASNEHVNESDKKLDMKTG